MNNGHRRGEMGVFVRIWLLALGILLGSSLALFAEEVGTIDYLEGVVDIHRDGGILELYPSDIGFSLELVDTIRTGEDGRVDFTLSRLKTPGTSISVGNNTTFRIATSLEAQGTATRIELFGGSLSLKVAKLAGREELTVQTESAAMGVRGTSFEVVTAADGGVLVLCDEGRVSCSDLNRREEFAYSGQAVEKVPGDPLQPLAVDPAEFNEFKRDWKETRMEIFQSGAPVFIRAYAQQYSRISPRFNEAYQKLGAFEPRLTAYARRAAEGGTPLSRGDMVRFRAEISPALTEMRSVLPIFRQTFFRLDELARYVQTVGVDGGAAVGELTVSEYIQRFSRGARGERQKLARVDHWFTLYRELSRSSADDPFGGESLMDEFFSPDEGSLLEEL